MSDYAIKVENVSKKFCRSIKHTMLYGATDLTRSFLGMNQHTEHLRTGEFWATDQVSFNVEQGESIALIGVNGSGKSTLLKMLNGIFMPDVGKITIRGKTNALIEVGAGFHPMLTGRENIYVNGAILGMSKADIDKRFEEIVDFADIGDFLDSPVKHYSSGMYVRLGFSVAIHCRPDILLVDEVLAVGDAQFQARCYSAFSKMINNGVSIVLVSHNLSDVQRVTKRCIWIQDGKIRSQGNSNKVITDYTIFNEEHNKLNKLKSSETETLPQDRKPGAKIVEMIFCDQNGAIKTEFTTGEKMIVRIKYKILNKIDGLNVSFSFSAVGGEGYTGCWSKWDEFLVIPQKEYGIVELTFPELLLNTGVYVVNVGLWDKDFIGAYDWSWGDKSFTVRNPKPMSGKFYLNHQWKSIEE